jgi:hypothetical protein
LDFQAVDVNSTATQNLYACQPFLDGRITPLRGAIEWLDEKLVKRLIEAEAKVNAVVYGTQTTLQYTTNYHRMAPSTNVLTIEEMLIDVGADVTRLDETPALYVPPLPYQPGRGAF